MTPQEIADYKQRWMSTGKAYSVTIHEDLDIRGKDWCRKNLQRHQWSFRKYTDVYEHTFFFENNYMGQQFEQEFYNWTKKNHN